MKVILLKDLKNVGKKNDIVELKDNYARNCVIKLGYGVEANSKTLNDLKLKVNNDEKIKEQTYVEALKIKELLKEEVVVICVKTGENGKMFGSITAKEIADAIRNQLKVDIDKRKIQMKAPIKTICDTTVKIKLHTNVIAELKVHVTEMFI